MKNLEVYVTLLLYTTDFETDEKGAFLTSYTADTLSQVGDPVLSAE